MFAPHVRELQLQYCGQLDNAAFRSLFALTELEALDLYGPYLVYQEVWLEFFPKRGAQLTCLRLRETPRFGLACLQAMVAHCGQLREVALAQLGQLRDDGVLLLRSLEHLERLDVSQPGVSQPGVPPASLSDDGVVPLLEARGAQLVSLDVSKNAALTHRTVAAMQACTKLEALAVNFLDGVEPAAWAALFPCLPRLTSLSMARCQIGDDVVAALARSCRALRHLDLNGNDDLTPAAFESLARAALPLETLDVGFVRCVDDDVLAPLVRALPSLQKVYVFGCPNVVRLSCLTQTRFRDARLTLLGRERR